MIRKANCRGWDASVDVKGGSGDISEGFAAGDSTLASEGNEI